MVEPGPAPASAAPRAGEALADRAKARPDAAPETTARSAAAGVQTMEDEAAPVPQRKRAEDAMTFSAAPEPPASAPVSPETLLDRIEAMYAKGRTEEADRALREFCRSFPAHTLPEALNRHADRLGLDCARR
jgi:hypothetical protein